jgi:hypothetical protein
MSEVVGSPVISTKVCKKCKTEHPLDKFRKNPKTKDGLKTECSACDDIRAKEYYQKNKKKIIKNIMAGRKKKEKLAEEIENLQKLLKLDNPA